MIDIVYPLGHGSRWDNNELRYSLRSVEKNVTGVRKVFLVGQKPSWVKNVVHIAFPDDKSIADENIRFKVLAACSDKRISSDFLFMNDDHFIMKPVEAEKFPYYYADIFKTYLRRGDQYGLRCRNSHRYLIDNNYSTLFYDIHYPIVYNKKKAEQIFSGLKPKYSGYILKSLYGNMTKPISTKIVDCKFDGTPKETMPCFSTLPIISEKSKLFLQTKFPNKSKYEV